MEEPTQTAAADDDDGSVPTAATERWSALPGDLLNVIYLRLVAGPIVDRLSFAAVCGWWRAVASTHPRRRLLPWLVLDPGGGDRAKHVHCLEDDVVLPPRFRFPGEVVGGHDGGWVAVLDAPLRIVNLFSGVEVALSAKQRRIVRLRNKRGSSVDDRFVPLKVIFSEPPTSSGCILAAITERDEVAICGLGRPRCAWVPRRLPGKTIMDIAFCDSLLYCLVAETMEIVRFKFGLTKHGVFRSDPQWLPLDGLYSTLGDPNDQSVYMVELHGNMVIAVRKKGWSPSRNTFVPSFSVSKLVEVVGGMHKWYKLKHLKSLGDHALFLSTTFSKAMHMSSDDNGYLHRNNIYYSHHRCYPRIEDVPAAAEEFLTVSNSDGHRVYYKTHYKEDESVQNNVEGITTVGHYVMGADKYPPVWLFPPDL